MRKVINIDRKMLSAIEKWRNEQEPNLTLSDAVRRLVAAGLGNVRPLTRASRKSASKAAAMASREIDRLGNVPQAQRDRAKRQLLKGPSEFHDIRKDRQNPKGN